MKSQNFSRVFREKIKFYLNSIRKKHGKTCYICLSGGLDSTIIAYFASKIFKNLIAVTARFKYSSEKNILSEDMLIANKISKELKISIINLFFNYEDIDKKINKILKASQDWRDYNVHCATLNYFIAEELSKKNIINPVLTGDMMNEFCVDYKAETFQKKKYYELPNIDKKILQRYLINGLDSSSREISVFNHFNIPLYQPYSMVIDLYKNILPKQINFKNFKNNCNGKLLPKNIFNLVSKKKNRAQMTDKMGGILGYFIKKNYNQNKLIKIFQTKLNVTDIWMKNFIVAGQFKTK